MLQGLTFAKAAQAIGVKGFAAIGLAVALAIVMWRADAISESREEVRNALAAERANHAVTRESVDTLTTALGRFVGAGKAAKVAQLASMEAQAEDSAALQREANAIRAEMATFGTTGTDANGRCVTPKSILDAKGL